MVVVVALVAFGGFMSIFVGTSDILLFVAVTDVVGVDTPLLPTIGVAINIFVGGLVVPPLPLVFVVLFVLAISSPDGDDGGDFLISLISMICGVSSSDPLA